MLSLTLDTNCIIDLQKDRSNDFRFAMERLLQLAESGQLDLAVTTRVEGETKYPSTFEAYRDSNR